MKAFVGVGSNIRPEEHLVAGFDRLAAWPGVILTHVSTVYACAPEGRENQPTFLNTVWGLESELAPRTLKFDVLRRVEQACGRQRTGDRNAPRTLDLDLLLCGDHVERAPDLTVPDPDIFIRPFVAVPLLEVAGDIPIPGTEQTLAELESARTRRGLEPCAAITVRLRERLGGA